MMKSWGKNIPGRRNSMSKYPGPRMKTEGRTVRLEDMVRGSKSDSVGKLGRRNLGPLICGSKGVTRRVLITLEEESNGCRGFVIAGIQVRGDFGLN